MHAGAPGLVEVVFVWRDGEGQAQVLDVEHVDSRPGASLWIGSGQRFVLPHAISAAWSQERFCLVRRDTAGFVFALPPGATCAGLDAPCSMLREGQDVEVHLDRFSFFVRPSAALKSKVGRGAWLEPNALGCIAATLAVHAVFLGLSFLAPPNAAALQLDRDESRLRYVSALLTQPEHVPEEFDYHPGNAPRDREASTAPVVASVSVSRGQGREGAAQRGSLHTNVPLTQEQVRNSGVLRQLSGSLANIMGDEWSALGNPERADGTGGPGLQWDAAGMLGTGFGGLNMNGHGRGSCVGEHCGEDAIPLGGTGSGSLCGCADFRDFGRGFGHSGTTAKAGLSPRPQGIRESHLPQVRTLSVASSGGLSADQIRRAVRRHINEVRSCYEDALLRRPNLEGRVSVRFMISATGTVQSSDMEGDATLTEVGACIAQASRRWSFPSSEGPTLVSYPFLLDDMN
jgi:hypothetical protein